MAKTSRHKTKTSSRRLCRGSNKKRSLKVQGGRGRETSRKKGPKNMVPQLNTKVGERGRAEGGNHEPKVWRGGGGSTAQ